MVNHAGKKSGALKPVDASSSDPRAELLVAMIDHCTAAKEAADKLDERFLSYLLSMAIQEAAATMRKTR